MKKSELLLDPVTIAKRINIGLRIELDKARERNRAIGENYPSFPDILNEKEPRT